MNHAHVVDIARAETALMIQAVGSMKWFDNERNARRRYTASLLAAGSPRCSLGLVPLSSLDRLQPQRYNRWWLLTWGFTVSDGTSPLFRTVPKVSKGQGTLPTSTVVGQGNLDLARLCKPCYTQHTCPLGGCAWSTRTVLWAPCACPVQGVYTDAYRELYLGRVRLSRSYTGFAACRGSLQGESVVLTLGRIGCTASSSSGTALLSTM